MMTVDELRKVLKQWSDEGYGNAVIQIKVDDGALYTPNHTYKFHNTVVIHHGFIVGQPELEVKRP